MHRLAVLASVGVAVASCDVTVDRHAADRQMMSTSTGTAEPLTRSESATVARVEELRARFRLPAQAVATGFEAAGGSEASTHLRAVLPTEALRGVTRRAHVALPLRANGEVSLEDETSRVAVRFALDHVQNTRVVVGGGMAIYRAALDTGNARADVVHRVHAEGTEDYVVFEARPAREELTYSVDVSRVPGLRLVSNTLELLDTDGTPLLRVAPPYVVDAHGQRHEARLAVNGCAYDTSPAGPWGRKVTAPGAARCSVQVAWAGDLTYPAMVDPAWVATGSMATARYAHTSSVLPSGRVLVVGGRTTSSGYLASAELFNPAGNAGAGTFAATGSAATVRYGHTASVLPSGKVLVTGGLNATTFLATAEIFDPAGNAGAGTFAATASMSTARGHHTASVLPSGKVLIAGGCNAPSNACQTSLATAEVFDPAGNAGAGTFAATSSMSTVRVNHSASLLPSGRVLIAGGLGSVGIVATAELFNPAANAGAGAFVATGSMALPRTSHTASALPSGKVLVAGGLTAGSTFPPSAELFDPTGNAGAGTFVPTGAMARGHSNHTASVLPSGKVLFAGTWLSDASSEMFDPGGNAGAGTFDRASAMATPRYSHAASVLPSGKVLVTGGQSAVGVFASAELFSVVATGPCAGGADCLSGFCADGVCCNTACNGSCDRCDLPGKAGICTLTPVGSAGVNPACVSPYLCNGVDATCTSCASDAACLPEFYCNSSGACEARKAQAAACNTQANCKQPGCRECTSGFCVDGVCCDKACSGQCDACDAFVGACAPIAGTPHGSRSACAPGNECSASTNRCEVLAGCDGDHTATRADGTKADCTPYRCEGDGTCRATCTSVTDCVAPTICDPAGKCVPPSPPDEGGCGVTRAEPRNAQWLFASLAAAGLALVRRRRR